MGVLLAPCARSMKCVQASKKRSGFETPLTRIVCTPCYRAPEVGGALCLHQQRCTAQWKAVHDAVQEF